MEIYPFWNLIIFWFISPVEFFCEYHELEYNSEQDRNELIFIADVVPDVMLCILLLNLDNSRQI